MTAAIPTSPARSRRPRDIFKGAAVEREFAEEVLDIIRKVATLHQTFIEGTLVSSFERQAPGVVLVSRETPPRSRCSADYGISVDVTS